MLELEALNEQLQENLISYWASRCKVVRLSGLRDHAGFFPEGNVVIMSLGGIRLHMKQIVARFCGEDPVETARRGHNIPKQHQTIMNEKRISVEFDASYWGVGAFIVTAGTEWFVQIDRS